MIRMQRDGNIRTRVLLALAALVLGVTLATMQFGFAGGLGMGCVIAVLGLVVTPRVLKHEDEPNPQACGDLHEEPVDIDPQPAEPIDAADTEDDEVAEVTEAALPEPEQAPVAQSEPAQEAPPAQDATTDSPAISQRQFDMAAFMQSVLTPSQPLATLRTIADDIRSRKDGSDTTLPIEDFLERELVDAGLYEDDAEVQKHVRVVLLHHSKLFYVRMPKHDMTYGTWLRMIRIESVLNALLLAFENFDDLSLASIEDLYKLRQRVITSICSQAPTVDTADWSYLAMPWQVPYGPSEQGEWAVRQAVSEAIESVRLPYRLEVRFRCNVAEGDVALEFGATPARAFPNTIYTQGLGLVPTTRQMRTREAASYAARVGLLLAGYTFHASNRIRRVWISAIEETPKTHSCLYSVCVERRAFASIRLDRMHDPIGCLQRLGASMRLAEFELLPVEPRFYLEDDRFCPSYRHDLWQLSERSLPPETTQPLGCARVSGLLIHEQLPRDVVADKILRALPTNAGAQNTQRSVHTVLETAHSTSDVTVWSAADRVATKLVEGTLDWSQPDKLRTEFVEGDSLSRTLSRAQELLAAQRPHDAMHMLSSMLRQFDAEGRYHDSSTVAYRCFDSFVERVIYNRLNRDDKRSVVLAPDAYPVAHLTLSALYASLPNDDGGDAQKALYHARRALEVAPLSVPAHLGVSACLETMGDVQGAVQQLCTFLKTAFYNQSIGIAYFRLASLQWTLGNRDACRACYFQATRAMPALMPFALAEYESLSSQDGDSTTYEVTEEQVMQALTRASIPLAPTNSTAFLLYDGAVASVDAEVFPVAHDLLLALEALTGDDVLHGIRMSLEHEPDA
ncbi:MAG: hypothetical protein Q4A07_05690 [Coriobacteriales bacterium]|nr:hypothetical protein [Coriobacteriales bacterium]